MSILNIIFWIIVGSILAVVIPSIIFWRRTNLPERLRERKQRRTIEKQIRKEARQEALTKMKPELVEMYKQQELEKARKRSIPLGQKIANEFTSINTGDKVGMMLGQQQPPQPQHQRKHIPRPKVQRPRQEQQTQKQKMETYEEKMKRLMG
tara:strand:+ start:270 stop:722 length:453 start_codon:yes stop_codon:yes gene_type:complete